MNVVMVGRVGRRPRIIKYEVPMHARKKMRKEKYLLYIQDMRNASGETGQVQINTRGVE